MKAKAGLLILAMLGLGPAAGQDELISAVIKGQTELALELAAQGAEVNVPGRDGATALQWAIYHENGAAVAGLIAAGADVEAANREGISPLALAAMTGNAEIIRLLLEAGAKVNRPLENGETPLMMAARTGSAEAMRMFLDWGADIDATEKLRGTTALMWAAANGNPDAVSLLLERGASYAMTSAAISPGRNPYLAPSARDRIRQFYRGVGQSGSFVAEGDEEEIAELAVSREELLERLPPSLVEDFERELAAEPEPEEERQWGGLTAMHFAAREGSLEIVKRLAEAGADVNQTSAFGWTPLLTATQNRYYQIGNYLLERGADPNIANEGGWNPLYIATDNRNIEGGDYPTRKPDLDHLEFIKLLLDAGANPNLRMRSSTETRTIFTHQWLREEGATPFLRAAQSSDLELMKLLLNYGADPNINTELNVTPLMVAAGIGWVEGVTFEWSEEANREALLMLLELGNDVNAQDLEDYRTALMGAAHKGRNYAVEILVDAGGDLSLRDIGSRDSLHQLAGATWQAIDYADGLVRVGVQSAVGHPETAALIRELMIERGLEVPPEGRTLDSICIVAICK